MEINSRDFYNILEKIIDEAKDISPNLATKTQYISNWINSYNVGFLNSQPLVGKFLNEFIQDSKIHLALADPSNNQEIIKLLEEKMTPTAKYWHKEIFPKWLNKRDDKISNWKNKLMKGQRQKDEDYLESLLKIINAKHNSTTFKRYIADFSISTDLIVSYHQQKACCIQLTTSRLKYCDQKIEKWKYDLNYWDIKKGIFMSFDSTEDLTRITNQLLWKVDNLEDGEYHNLKLK